MPFCRPRSHKPLFFWHDERALSPVHKHQLQLHVCHHWDGRAVYRISCSISASATSPDIIRPATNPLAVTKKSPANAGLLVLMLIHWTSAMCQEQILLARNMLNQSAHACIPLPLARLILSTHSLNALTCSGESSDSSMLVRRALRERSIWFFVNRKQITLTQRGENLLRPIALVIRSFMRCLLIASGGDLKLGYNTRGEDLCDYSVLEISKGRFAWGQSGFQ